MIKLKDLLSESNEVLEGDVSNYLRYLVKPLIEELHAAQVTEEGNDLVCNLEFTLPDGTTYYIQYNFLNDEYNEILVAMANDKNYRTSNIEELQHNDTLYNAVESEVQNLAPIAKDLYQK